ncbi:elongation factor P-like protein YeiP [Aestuariicella hydrocarbonica]|uniref:Elongation factor P-like protein n=1 Tax=Pseudomaricurvus hydrocarbonicus TaxID=1470433 RepID=A0A9E5MLB7_9GAMM|nr:elongation factor P-like protein YeiP [Aestuariicella hydrocarbonica]NHO64208.1 elongation factor P-like protein YeiP [Aestuariicella hydrocarbonica]
MPKVSEIKKNTAVEFNDSVYVIRTIERSVPQGRAGGSIYRMRMYDVVTGHKTDQSFKESEMLNLANLTRRPANFSYSDGDEYVFMDSEDYSSYSFNKQQIEEELLFITEDTEGLVVLIVNDAPVALDLPVNVDLEIVQTDPALKGGSATARTKPAILSTGLTVQVPEHIASGERITVSVEDRRFISRAESK